MPFLAHRLHQMPHPADACKVCRLLLRSATWIRQQDGSRVVQQPVQVRGVQAVLCAALQPCCVGLEGTLTCQPILPSPLPSPPLPAPALQEPRPHRQAGCPSIESRCDKLLGPKACLTLRGWRNGAEAVGALLASLAVLALTISFLIFSFSF